MPTGFDVESGSALSGRLAPLAPRLASLLQRMRASGSATPREPVTAHKIIEHARAAGFTINNSDVCAMVNALRRSGHPIASNSSGYFWALSEAELSSTVQHMRERIAAMQCAISGMTRRFYSGQPELPLHT